MQVGLHPVARGKRAISRYDASTITCSPRPSPPPGSASHHVSTGCAVERRGAEVHRGARRRRRNQTTSPARSRMRTPRWPGPEDGARKSRPGAVSCGGCSTVTTGGSRSGRERKRCTPRPADLPAGRREHRARAPREELRSRQHWLHGLAVGAGAASSGRRRQVDALTSDEHSVSYRAIHVVATDPGAPARAGSPSTSSLPIRPRADGGIASFVPELGEQWARLSFHVAQLVGRKVASETARPSGRERATAARRATPRRHRAARLEPPRRPQGRPQDPRSAARRRRPTAPSSAYRAPRPRCARCVARLLELAHAVGLDPEACSGAVRARRRRPLAGRGSRSASRARGGSRRHHGRRARDGRGVRAGTHSRLLGRRTPSRGVCSTPRRPRTSASVRTRSRVRRMRSAPPPPAARRAPARPTSAAAPRRGRRSPAARRSRRRGMSSPSAASP